jgi:hypothetical protein
LISVTTQLVETLKKESSESKKEMLSKYIELAESLTTSTAKLVNIARECFNTSGDTIDVTERLLVENKQFNLLLDMVSNKQINEETLDVTQIEENDVEEKGEEKV